MASEGALTILYASIARGSEAKRDFSLDMTSNDSLRTSFKISRWYTWQLADTRGAALSRSAPVFLTHGYREQRRYRPISYRVAYLLLPLENVGHWVLTGELYVTVEDNALPKNSRDVHRVLLTESWNINSHGH